MVNIYFYREVPAKEIVASMKKHLRLNFSEDKFDGMAGKALEIDGLDYVIYLRDKKMISTLAHECLHITNMILHSKGVLPSFENDEAQAYLLGWIMKKCLEIK